MEVYKCKLNHGKGHEVLEKYRPLEWAKEFQLVKRHSKTEKRKYSKQKCELNHWEFRGAQTSNK
jgi:hypothetical protein